MVYVHVWYWFGECGQCLVIYHTGKWIFRVHFPVSSSPGSIYLSIFFLVSFCHFFSVLFYFFRGEILASSLDIRSINDLFMQHSLVKCAARWREMAMTSDQSITTNRKKEMGNEGQIKYNSRQERGKSIELKLVRKRKRIGRSQWLVQWRFVLSLRNATLSVGITVLSLTSIDPVQLIVPPPPPSFSSLLPLPPPPSFTSPTPNSSAQLLRRHFPHILPFFWEFEPRSATFN